MKTDVLRVFAKIRPRRRQPHRQYASSLETGVHSLQAQEAPKEQARPDQQGQSQRDFGGHQRATQTIATRSGAALRALFHGFLQFDPRALPRRSKTKNDRRRQRKEQREAERRQVERDLTHAREVRRQQSRQGVHAPPRQQQTEQAAGQSERQIFRQQLSQHPPARRAQSGAHRQLAPPRRRPRQQQVGDVGARDQQHAADRAEQQPERSARVADQVSLQRDDAVEAIVVCLRVLLS